MTLSTFMLCIVSASFADVATERKYKPMDVLRSNIAPVAVVVAMIACYSITGWAAIADYIRFAAFGTQVYSYSEHGGAWHQARYYLTGAGGRASIGTWYWPALTLMIGAAWLKWRHRTTNVSFRVVSTVVVCAYLFAFVSSTLVKSPYVGCIVPWLFLLFFIQALNRISIHANKRAFAAFVIVLAVFGVIRYQTQWHAKMGRQGEVAVAQAEWRRELLGSVADDLIRRNVQGVVFFTSSAQYMNAVTLELELAKRGYWAISVEEMPYAMNADDFQGKWRKADYIVAFSPDNHDAIGFLPTNMFTRVTWDALQVDRGLVRLQSFPNRSGGEIVLFGRMQKLHQIPAG